MINAPSAGTGENHDREGRKDYTDKSDPVIEHDYIWWMACVTVCPTTAIKVEEANLDVHKKMEESQVNCDNTMILYSSLILIISDHNSWNISAFNCLYLSNKYNHHYPYLVQNNDYLFKNGYIWI